MRVPRAAVTATLAASVLALAACSSGGGHSASTTSSRPKSAPAAATAAKPSAGCRAAPVKPGDDQVTITSSGASRWFYRHVPPSYTGATPMPVVVDIHGYAEGATIHQRMTELGPYGDTHGFITITPQGEGQVARWDTSLGGADVKFIGDLLDDVDRTLCVDDSRVFVTGLSNGAFMTSAVACAYADRVAAVAPVAGIQDIAGCAPARAVPVVAFHGTADPFVSYDGGLGPKALQLPAPDGSGRTLGQSGAVANATKGPSIPAITAAWAKRNRCAPTPHEQTVASDVTLIRYDCPPGADVELYRITGGGHAWPGSAFSRAIVATVGPTTFSISADDVIWRFFTDHPLAG
ncbi:MAG TPA: PHB depolymerase family esterase [Acidimicrobiia bacterium]